MLVLQVRTETIFLSQFVALLMERISEMQQRALDKSVKRAATSFGRHPIERKSRRAIGFGCFHARRMPGCM